MEGQLFFCLQIFFSIAIYVYIFANILGFTEGERAYAFIYLSNTIIMWICNFIPQLLISLLLAAWLTETKFKLKATGMYKVIVYLPSIITAASVEASYKRNQRT